jgi:hypothetical protein
MAAPLDAPALLQHVLPVLLAHAAAVRAIAEGNAAAAAPRGGGDVARVRALPRTVVAKPMPASVAAALREVAAAGEDARARARLACVCRAARAAANTHTAAAARAEAHAHARACGAVALLLARYALMPRGAAALKRLCAAQAPPAAGPQGDAHTTSWAAFLPRVAAAEDAALAEALRDVFGVAFEPAARRESRNLILVASCVRGASFTGATVILALIRARAGEEQAEAATQLVTFDEEE